MALISTIAAALIFISEVILASTNNCPLRSNNQETENYEVKLHGDLLCGYNSSFRPVKNHRDTVDVSVAFFPKYTSFDSLEEVFTVHTLLLFTWFDEFLEWKPADYDGIDEILMESRNIWTPPFTLFNSDKYDEDNSIYTTCSVHSFGLVSCFLNRAQSGLCSSSLRRWPYDSQNCTMVFGAPMYTGEQINLTVKNISFDMKFNDNGSGWKLLKVENERLPGNISMLNRTYPRLQYTFIMKRESAGPAAIVVIPSIAIVLLTLISLLIDIKDNTRLFLACFSLHGHFTFLAVIGYNIPKHSFDTPILLLFIRDSMIVTLMVIVLTLVLMAMRRRETSAPAWMVAVNRLVTGSAVNNILFTKFDSTDISTGKLLRDSVSEEQAVFLKEWIDFANLVNSCMVIISVIVYITLIGSYIPVDD
ncbi:neuronal acetylcholine receptor subunit beta-3-like [Epargyreus clarus]|uniref:neuronal acetylcholine receptor subunit beta-3-like n=1 Tax=Epargyreus clarus TaxID=520877 RepID=UPI003C2E63AB